MTNASNVPAVVVGAGLNGLGVVRSLARAGVCTWLLDTDSRAEMRTRMARSLLVPSTQGQALVDELVRLGETRFRGQRPVLLLTQEESVKTVSLQRGALAPYYRFTLPDDAILERLLHKEGFQRLAEQSKAPIPPLVHIRGESQLSALGGLRFPIVLKPGERHAGYGREFKKAYRLEQREEAEQLIRHILPIMSDIVAQEWIEGGDASLYFCMQYIAPDGSVAASFTGRKIRAWPPQVGGTASCTIAPEATQTLTDLTTRFFTAFGVVGLAAMEYKRDARTGHFLMVEPTVGRTDYQAEVATLNGVNLPFAAYCTEVGRPVPTPAARLRPVVWRDRLADRQSAAKQSQRHGEGIPRGAIVRDALWRWSDPLPFLLTGTRRLWNAIRVRGTRVRHKKARLMGTK